MPAQTMIISLAFQTEELAARIRADLESPDWTLRVAAPAEALSPQTEACLAIVEYGPEAEALRAALPPGTGPAVLWLCPAEQLPALERLWARPGDELHSSTCANPILKARLGFHHRLHAQGQVQAEDHAIKQKLFSLISHDLRSPFSSMIGVISLLVQDYAAMSDQERLEFLKALLSNSNQQMALLDNLMYWSRVQSGRLQVNPKPVDLGGAIAAAFAYHGELARGKRISLVSRVPDELRVWADSDQLQAILRNLIHNAVKFSPSDRAVVVRCGNPPPGPGQCLVQVDDFGPGFPVPSPEFRQAGGASTPGSAGEKGAGIGLFIASRLAEMQGAKLSLLRSSPQGSSLGLLMPLPELAAPR